MAKKLYCRRLLGGDCEMTIGKANCLVCGDPLVYWGEAREATCHICGKKELGHCACESGHYICNTCHRVEGVDYILGLCSRSESTDPIEIVNEAMQDKSIYPNGPEHHTLIGAALITAYANAGGKNPKGEPLNKAAALSELRKRSLQVPGGACGFWGACGAAVSAGQAMSVLNGSTPLSQEPWAQCQRLTSMILGRLADLGGPRCCKRTGYTAIIAAVPYIDATLGANMQLPVEVTCSFFANNAECRRKECPYFPGADEEVKAAFQPGAFGCAPSK